jgi:hypothetical protein
MLGSRLLSISRVSSSAQGCGTCNYVRGLDMVGSPAAVQEPVASDAHLSSDPSLLHGRPRLVLLVTDLQADASLSRSSLEAVARGLHFPHLPARLQTYNPIIPPTRVDPVYCTGLLYYVARWLSPVLLARAPPFSPSYTRIPLSVQDCYSSV